MDLLTRRDAYDLVQRYTLSLYADLSETDIRWRKSWSPSWPA